MTIWRQLTLWMGAPALLAVGLALVVDRFGNTMHVGTSTQPHGMTWGVGLPSARPGVTLVSCHGQPYAATVTGSCDAYIGDTACSTALPVLCLRQDRRPAPDAGLRDSWGEGEIALAPAVAGSTFGSQAEADTYCSTHLGPGWRLAEHHDGQGHGWMLHAAGAIAQGTRFWVANNDMPANCWNSTSRPRTDAQFGPGSDDAPQLLPRDVHFSGTVKFFDGGCFADASCSIVVGNRTIYLPSPRQDGGPAGVSGHVDRLPAGEEWVGQSVEVHCRLLRGTCSLEGRADYYIRLTR